MKSICFIPHPSSLSFVEWKGIEPLFLHCNSSVLQLNDHPVKTKDEGGEMKVEKRTSHPSSFTLHPFFSGSDRTRTGDLRADNATGTPSPLQNQSLRFCRGGRLPSRRAEIDIWCLKYLVSKVQVCANDASVAHKTALGVEPRYAVLQTAAFPRRPYGQVGNKKARIPV